MKVIMFQPRFAALVEIGAKRQTVRPVRRLPVEAKDVLSLRAWTGLPYRSKQRHIRWAVCEGVRSISIDCHDWRIKIEGEPELGPADANTFAKADGFKNSDELFQWFSSTHRPGDVRGHTDFLVKKRHKPGHTKPKTLPLDNWYREDGPIPETETASRDLISEMGHLAKDHRILANQLAAMGIGFDGDEPEID